ncbi:hypothetical protein F6X40_10065 [Paraburkholderia sp. UCT31]|uniref:hypothetical protein n=1 Tax=Paraburkholderia sp. UCT31 TaxID=2615209 RepID=UPI001655D667|nr:hypothetical protein [Paraburkholderia sp. UCT31]MBC8737152.1 hypothetical protein [Paraburkholderia sp. UCT31]
MEDDFTQQPNPAARALGRRYLVAVDAAAEAKRELQAASEALAAAACPHKRGETAVSNGFTFEGKTFLVEQVSIETEARSRNPSRLRWRAEGRVLKRDGTPSLSWAYCEGEFDPLGEWTTESK